MANKIIIQRWEAIPHDYSTNDGDFYENIQLEIFQEKNPTITADDLIHNYEKEDEFEFSFVNFTKDGITVVENENFDFELSFDNHKIKNLVKWLKENLIHNYLEQYHEFQLNNYTTTLKQ